MIKKIIVITIGLYACATFHASFQKRSTFSWPIQAKQQLSRITTKQWLALAGAGAASAALWQFHKRSKTLSTKIKTEMFPNLNSENFSEYLLNTEYIEYSNPTDARLQENFVILNCLDNSPLCPLTPNLIVMQNNTRSGVQEQYTSIYDYIIKMKKPSINTAIQKCREQITQQPEEEISELVTVLQFLYSMYQCSKPFKEALDDLSIEKTIILQISNAFSYTSIDPSSSINNAFYWGVDQQINGTFNGKNIYGYLLTYLKNNVLTSSTDPME